MTIAKLAYLTSPAPDRYVLVFQFVDTLGNEVVQQIEITQAHLGHIVADGAHYAFRKQSTHRVPVSASQNEGANVGYTETGG